MDQIQGNGKGAFGVNVLIYSPQCDYIGGIETHLSALSVYLCETARFSVHFVSTSNSLSADLLNPMLEAGVTVDFMPTQRGRARKSDKFLWLLRRVLRWRCDKWDVIYTNGQGALTWLIWAAYRPGTKIFHHHHTSADSEERRGWGRYYRQVIRRAPTLIITSESIQYNVQQVRNKSRPVFAVPCLLSFAWNGPPPHGQCRERLRFGYFGRFIEAKGIGRIMELSQRKELQNIQWLLWGKGDEYPSDIFNMYPNIRYMGTFMGADGLKEVLNSLDAVVLLSRFSEGLPLMLLEAMSAGLPWIAFDKGGVKDVILRSPDCSMLPGESTADEVSAAILRLADDIVANRTSRSEVQLKFNEKFSPCVVGKQWMQLFAGKN